MKNLIMIFFALVTVVSVNAQDEKSDVSKEVVLQKVDKNTDLAFIYSNGNLVEKGILKNGKREGVWQSYNENGTLITEASFEKGKKEGVWVIYDNTDVKYVLHYQNGKMMKANDMASN